MILDIDFLSVKIDPEASLILFLNKIF